MELMVVLLWAFRWTLTELMNPLQTRARHAGEDEDFRREPCEMPGSRTGRGSFEPFTIRVGFA